MEALVCVVLQQGPGDAVVWGVMQEYSLPWLVWCRTWAQDASTAQPKSELQVPSGIKSEKKKKKMKARTSWVSWEV